GLGKKSCLAGVDDFSSPLPSLVTVPLPVKLYSQATFFKFPVSAHCAFDSMAVRPKAIDKNNAIFFISLSFIQLLFFSLMLFYILFIYQILLLRFFPIIRRITLSDY